MTELTGKIVLGPHRYGKAENRVVRIVRDTARHEIRDLNVSSCLRGDFDAAHLEGDQATVLPTDSQKQTIFSYAKEKGVAFIEDYGLALARHFVDDVDPVDSARIEIEEYAWERVVVDGAEHDHTWTRKIRGAHRRAHRAGHRRGPEGMGDRRTEGSRRPQVHGLGVRGLPHRPYTVLEPTEDRVMATSLVAQWRFTTTAVDWDADYAGIRATMLEVFATLQSKALQQTLFEMGRAVLEKYPFIAEIRLSAPNKHHFVYDLDRFGVENNNEVFHADDRPYGLIQASVLREDAPDAGIAWDPYTGAV